MTLTDGEAPAKCERVTLVLGNLTLIGTVIESGSFGGVASAQVVGGAGGWRTLPDPLTFKNDANLDALGLAHALAENVGETLVGEPYTLGVNWSFDSTLSAGGNLDAIGDWYMREDGVTVLGIRQDGPEVKALVDHFDPIRQRAFLEQEDDSLAAFLPGALLASDALTESIRIKHTRILLTGPRISVEVSAKEQASDRIAAHSVRKQRFLGTYLYRIIEQIDDRLDLQAVDPVNGQPDQVLVTKAHGLPGVLSDCSHGGSCLVVFANGDVSRPFVAAYLSGSLAAYFGERPTAENVALAPALIEFVSASSVIIGQLILAVSALAPGSIDPVSFNTFLTSVNKYMAGGAPTVQSDKLRAAPVGIP